MERIDHVTVRIYVGRIGDLRQPRAFYEADSLHTEIYNALAASDELCEELVHVHVGKTDNSKPIRWFRCFCQCGLHLLSGVNDAT